MAVLDLQSFAANMALADSDGLTAALRMLESCLAGPDISLDLIVQDLYSAPNLFEFVVSGEFMRHHTQILLVSNLYYSIAMRGRASAQNPRRLPDRSRACCGLICKHSPPETCICLVCFAS